MPTATPALPTEARKLPPLALRLFAKVYKSALVEFGGNAKAAAEIAWAGLKNAGWAPDPSRTGAFVMSKRRTRGSFEIDKKSGRWRCRAKIRKDSIREDLMQVFGWASTVVSEAAQVIVDHDQEIIPIAELSQAAYRYVRKSRSAGEMHERPGVGDLIESVVMTPSKRVDMGLDGSGKSGWWVGYQVTDRAVWKRIKSGDLAELSIGGSSIRKVLSDGETAVLRRLEIDEVSFVDAGAGIDVPIVTAKSITRKAGGDMSQSINEIIGMLPEESRNALLESFEDALSSAGLDPDGALAAMGLQSANSEEDADEGEDDGAADDGEADDGEEPEMKTDGAEEPEEEEAAQQAPPPAPKARKVAPPQAAGAKKVAPPQAAGAETKMPKSKNRHADPTEISKVRKERDDLRAERDDMKKRLIALEETNEMREFMAKAQKLPMIPGKSTEAIAKMLRRINKRMPEADAKEVMGTIELMHKAIATGKLFAELGTRAAGDGEVSEQIEALAKARAKEEKITFEQAYEKVLRDNPELYTEYTKQHPAKEIHTRQSSDD